MARASELVQSTPSLNAQPIQSTEHQGWRDVRQVACTAKRSLHAFRRGC
jgi:hypothetical protein